MPQPNRSPRGAGNGPGGGPPDRHRVVPVNLPVPAQASELYRRFGPQDVVHPRYPLLQMVAWHDEWKREAPRGSDGSSPNVKRQAYASARQRLNATSLREVAANVLARRRAWLEPLVRSGEARLLWLTSETDAVVHLASQGPLELGLALHHVYGFPILPATSLKGLSRASAGDSDAADVDEVYGKQEHVASLAVLDGLPVAFAIQPDVMTPHFGGWYQGKRAPDDTEGPVPIPFLSIAPGAVFEVALVSRNGTQAVALLDRFEEDLRRGLDERGLGAKTSAGYGVFSVTRVTPGAPPSEALGPKGAATSRPAAAPPAAPVLSPEDLEFAARMRQIQALKPADAGRLSGFLGWFESLTADDQRQQAARAIVAKSDPKWLKDKAKKDERWKKIREAAG